MKYHAWMLTLFCFARMAWGVTVTPVASTAMYVPAGFDDNDEVVVTLEGYLPSTCYQIANIEVTKDLATRQIVLQQMAYVVATTCSQIIIPFVTTVNLGRLPAGSYAVRTRDGQHRQTLVVDRAPAPWPDNYVYAPIESAGVGRLGGGYVVVLNGRYTNTCLRMRDIRVLPTGNTVQILPIMELLKSEDFGKPCRKVELPFRVTQNLPALKAGRYLVHVRSMNGRSVDTVFTVDP